MRPCLSLAVLLLAGAAVAGAKAVPDVTLKDLRGQRHKLSALRGNIVVLSFWATWCGPCQEELPRLSQLSAQYSGSPVRFIAVSIDAAKDSAKIEPLLAKEGVHLEVWTGADTDTMARVGLGNIVPSTLVLDERGEVITQITGEAREEDIRSGVDWLLGGRTGAPPALKRTRF